MTELEILAFIVLPLGTAIFGWFAVLARERRMRRVGTK
jgi:hypothetical protein